METRFINIQLFADEQTEGEDKEKDIAIDDNVDEDVDIDIGDINVGIDDSETDDIDIDLGDDGDESDSSVEEEKEQGASSRDNELEELRERLARAEAENKKRDLKSKEALKTLGYGDESEDIDDMLDTILADEEGVTLEEYRKKHAEEQTLKEAREIVNRKKLDDAKASDLRLLKQHIPATFSAKSLDDCFEGEELKRFYELRAKDVDTISAFYAATRGRVVTSSTPQSKSHLQQSIRQTKTGRTAKMPRESLRNFRNAFPEETDKQLYERWLDLQKSVK